MDDLLRLIIAVLLVIIGVGALAFCLLFLKFFRLWLQARLCRADVKFSEFIGMWLRKVDVQTIVLSKITATQAGLTLSTKDLESHYLAGGQTANVVRAMIRAKRDSIDLSWEDATAMDLDGRDVFSEVLALVDAKKSPE